MISVICVSVKVIRHHDQAAIRLACVYANDGCEFGRVTDGRRDRLHCERLCRGFEGLQPIFGIGRRCGVEQESDPETRGAISLSRSSHLPATPGSITMKPVTLAPGCEKLATKPLPSGSVTNTKMMGMLRVCCSKVAVVGVVCESMRSGCIATSSFAPRCSAATLPGAAQRVSIRTLRPSVQPSVWSPSRNAPKLA